MLGLVIVGIVTKQMAYGIFLQNNELGIYDWATSYLERIGGNLNDKAWHMSP
jgi:hypothetical protein